MDARLDDRTVGPVTATVTFIDRATIAVHVDHDEQYPVFFITSPSASAQKIEMTEAEHLRFVRASDEWEAVQEIVRERAGWKE